MTLAVADSAACQTLMEDVPQKLCRILLAVQREFHRNMHVTKQMKSKPKFTMLMKSF